MSRPTGTPGTLQLAAATLPARLDHDEQVWVQVDGDWDPWPGYYPGRFYPDDVPDWVTRCEHEHGPNGTRTCDTERECDQLAREDERTYGR